MVSGMFLAALSCILCAHSIFSTFRYLKESLSACLVPAIKKFIEASYIALLAVTSTVTFATEASEAQNMSIDMFPAKLEGYTRHVIRLPKLEGEARLDRVMIISGV